MGGREIGICRQHFLHRGERLSAVAALEGAPEQILIQNLARVGVSQREILLGQSGEMSLDAVLVHRILVADVGEQVVGIPLAQGFKGSGELFEAALRVGRRRGVGDLMLDFRARFAKRLRCGQGFGRRKERRGYNPDQHLKYRPWLRSCGHADSLHATGDSHRIAAEMLESRSPLQHRFDDDNERRQPAFAAALGREFSCQ